MKKKKGMAVLLSASLALVLAAGLYMEEALAYFTTYASASGRVQVRLDFTETNTGDEVRDWTKHIFIENTGESGCFVRVKVLAGEKYRDYLSYSFEREGSWELEEDGYWYYDAVLAPGEKTAELLAALNRELLKQEIENGGREEFNVIVVPEYAPVLYDEAGNPYADWEMKAGVDAGGARAENARTGGTGVDGVGVSGAAGGTGNVDESREGAE